MPFNPADFGATPVDNALGQAPAPVQQMQPKPFNPMDYGATPVTSSNVSNSNDSIKRAVPDFLAGIGKEAIKRGSDASRLGSSILDNTVGRVVNKVADYTAPLVGNKARIPQGFAPTKTDTTGNDAIDTAMAPKNTAESYGNTVENIGEYFVPAGSIGKVSKIGEGFIKGRGLLPFIGRGLTKATTEGVSNAGISYSQNQDAKEAGIVGAVAGVTAPIAKGLVSGYKALRDPVAIAAKNVSDWIRPTTHNVSAFNQARDVLTQSSKKGVNIPEFLNEQGINAEAHVENNAYATEHTANAMRQTGEKLSTDTLRPSLQIANPSVARVPLNTVETKAIEIAKTFAGTPDEKAASLAKIRSSFANTDEGSLSQTYKDGMQLTDLHDTKIDYSKKSGYNITNDPTITAENNKNRAISLATKGLLEDHAPEGIPVKAFNEYLQKYFTSADYLDALNTKKVPVTFRQKIARGFAKGVGAAVGAHFGSFPTEFAGYSLGGALEHAMENVPTPFRAQFLENLQKTNPAAFSKVQQYLTKEQVTNASRLKLPPGALSGTSENPIAIPQRPTSDMKVFTDINQMRGAMGAEPLPNPEPLQLPPGNPNTSPLNNGLPLRMPSPAMDEKGVSLPNYFQGDQNSSASIPKNTNNKAIISDSIVPAEKKASEFTNNDNSLNSSSIPKGLGQNDKVLITDKVTGKSGERFIHITKDGILTTKDAASGIPYRLDPNKWNIKIIEKNSSAAPKRGFDINSPEMIAEEKKTWDGKGQSGNASVASVFGTAALGAGTVGISSALAQVSGSKADYVRQPESKKQINVASVMAAIAKNETAGVEGDVYSFSKPSGSAEMGKDLGKYQVTSGELKSYAKEFLGRQVSDKEFLASPALQDAYMAKKIRSLIADGVPVKGIYAVHSQGMTGYRTPGVLENKILQSNQSRKAYVDRAVASYSEK